MQSHIPDPGDSGLEKSKPETFFNFKWWIVNNTPISFGFPLKTATCIYKRDGFQ